jgi:LDH2 family malate/lactate/ureidoglycolate dehydrogenase
MNNVIVYEDLVNTVESILSEGYGYSAEEARITAWMLVEADSRNVPSHGVSRLEFYRMNRDRGFSKPGARPEIIWETPCSLVVDGHDGVGGYVSEFCVRHTIEKAENAGTGFCAARSSNHFGMAGLWAETIARHDMIGMAFTNTRAGAIPTYGKERVLGTNPIAVGIPQGNKHGGIFLLDMATTTAAHGKVEVYDRRGKPMPLGWGVDENGVGMTDAAAFEKMFFSNPTYGGHMFLGGEGEENGGHKGFGLGLLVELLCSGLSLGMSTAETFGEGRGSGITHFFGAIRLDLFGRADELKKHIGKILDGIRESEKAAGQDRIYIHGEKESEARARSLKEGVRVDGATRELLGKLTDEFGLESPRWQ